TSTRATCGLIITSASRTKSSLGTASMISAASGQGRWGTWAEQAAVQVATRHELSTLALDGLILFRDACSMTLMAGSSATRLMLCRFFLGKTCLNRWEFLTQIVVTWIL